MTSSKGYITVIGGTTVDIVGYPYGELRMGDSNPGQTRISLGGVGQNIGGNLAQLDIDTRLITAIGKDLYGDLIKEENRKLGLKMEDVLEVEDQSTASYLALLNREGDMELAISSMDIMEELSVSFIEEKRQVIEESSLLIIDTNIPQDLIEYLVKNFQLDFFLDTVSSSKAMKVKDLLGYFHTIKPNKMEAEILSGIEIKSKKDLREAAAYFVNQGVKRVIISLGEDGIYYFDKDKELYIKTPAIQVVNATGAGDAFMAALGYGYFKGLEIEKTLKFALATSILTLESEHTINPSITVEKIKEKIKELEL